MGVLVPLGCTSLITLLLEPTPYEDIIDRLRLCFEEISLCEGGFGRIQRCLFHRFTFKC